MISDTQLRRMTLQAEGASSGMAARISSGILKAICERFGILQPANRVNNLLIRHHKLWMLGRM